MMPFSQPTTVPSFHRTPTTESRVRAAQPVAVTQADREETAAFPWLLIATSIGITLALAAAALSGVLVVLD